MLASVSCVLREGLAGQLDTIVGRMIQALQSEEGVTVGLELTAKSLSGCWFLSLF